MNGVNPLDESGKRMGMVKAVKSEMEMIESKMEEAKEKIMRYIEEPTRNLKVKLKLNAERETQPFFETQDSHYCSQANGISPDLKESKGSSHSHPNHSRDMESDFELLRRMQTSMSSPISIDPDDLSFSSYVSPSGVEREFELVRPSRTDGISPDQRGLECASPNPDSLDTWSHPPRLPTDDLFDLEKGSEVSNGFEITLSTDMSNEKILDVLRIKNYAPLPMCLDKEKMQDSTCRLFDPIYEDTVAACFFTMQTTTNGKIDYFDNLIHPWISVTKEATPEDFLQSFAQCILRKECIRFRPTRLLVLPEDGNASYDSMESEKRLSDVYATSFDSFYSYSKKQQPKRYMEYDRVYYVLSFEDQDRNQTLDLFIFLKDLSESSFSDLFFRIEIPFVLTVGYSIEDPEEIEERKKFPVTYPTWMSNKFSCLDAVSHSVSSVRCPPDIETSNQRFNSFFEDSDSPEIRSVDMLRCVPEEDSFEDQPLLSYSPPCVFPSTFRGVHYLSKSHSFVEGISQRPYYSSSGLDSPGSPYSTISEVTVP